MKLTPQDLAALNTIELDRRKLLQFYGEQIAALREELTDKLIEANKEFYRQYPHLRGRTNGQELPPELPAG